MTKAYHHSQKIIKNHVNAGTDDIIITAGFGMTAVVNKLQRILGLRTCGLINHHNCLKDLSECEKTHRIYFAHGTSLKSNILD